MNLPDLYSKYLEVESKYNLFDEYVKNELPLWYLLRFPIWASSIIVQKMKIASPSTNFQKQDFKTKTNIGFNLIKGTIAKNPFIGLKKYDILALGISQKEKTNNKFYDIYMDYLIEALNYDQIISFLPTAGKHYFPLAVKNYKFLDAVILSTAIKKLIQKPDNATINKIIELLKIFVKEFDLKLDIKKEATLLYYDKVFNFLQYKKTFEKILKTVKPKLIFENDHYGIKCIALNMVAKRMNIPSVELQHGIIDKYSIAYNYSNLKKNPDNAPLPKYIFLFGDYWKPACKLPIKEENKIITGFPHFDLKRKTIIGSVKKKNQIVFISQRTVGNKLSKFAFEIAQTLTDYNIVYKLHPQEYYDWKKNYGFLANLNNIEVADKKAKKSLYNYFAESKIQVGVYSTALYEGLGFSLKTFVVKLPGFECFQNLIDSGYVVLVDTPSEIVNNLHSKTNRTEQIHDSIWKSDSLNNMISAMEKILNQC